MNSNNQESIGADSPNIKKGSLLTQLFTKYRKQPSVKVETEIFKHTCYLVEILARKYADRGVPIDDLLQVGNLGLVKAIRNFEPEQKVQFATYATPTIEGEIKRYFRDYTWDVSVPRRLTELQPKIDGAFERLCHQFKRHPTKQEIADYLELPLEEILEASAVKNLYHSVSLDTTYTEEESYDTLHHVLGEEDPNIENLPIQKTILNALNKLTKKERLLIYYRYYQGLSQRIVAEKLKLTQMQVSRIEHKILGKLKTFTSIHKGLK